jgi:hypothetical protein
MRLELSTVLLQWAAGGLFGGWLTTRRREVGVGYGWLVRGGYAALGLGGVAASFSGDGHGAGVAVRNGAGIVMVACTLIVLVASIARRSAPVDDRSRGFPPVLDLLAPTAGLVALLGAAAVDGGPYALGAARLVIGAVFLGLVTDAMLLGHWYLVQSRLSRAPVRDLVRLVMVVWPIEVVLLLAPTGMLSVLDGRIDDGYDGLLGWTWVVSTVTTLGLAFAAWRALEERFYSAVMAATGLLYLAILTAFGTDVLARALLAS